MRALPPAFRLPDPRAGVAGVMLLLAAAVAWAQTLVIPALRDPALSRDLPRAGAGTCRVCGEISSIREVHAEPSIPGSQDPGRNVLGNPGGLPVGGTVIMLPFGPGGKENPYVGGVGTQEMAERMGTSTYEVTIRMDGGERRIVRRRDAGSYYVGQRVTLSGDMIAPL